MINLKILIKNSIEKEIFTIKKSKFITYIAKINSKEELKDFLENKIAKKATHNCFAYRLGFEKLTYGFNNDGEPKGTSGEPLLKLIESKKITNIVILVTRFFGGIKLGVGGLQKAYIFKAIEMLKKLELKNLILLYNVQIEFNINDIKKINLFLNKISKEITLIHEGLIVKANIKIENISILEKIKNFIQIKNVTRGYY